MARTGYGKHATQVDTSTYPDDPSVPIGSDEWNAEPSDSGMLGFSAETIASATSITPSNTVLNISGSTNISTIAQGNTNEYDLLYVFTSGTVTLEHNTGNLQLISGANKDLSTTVPTILIRKGTDWVEYGGGGNVTGTVMSGHIIPDANDTYDIGSAEFKIRDMYVSDNSLWIGDNHKVDIQGGKMKFKKRKSSSVPAVITSGGGNEAGAKSHSGKGTLEAIKLNEWVAYARSLGGSLANAKPNDIFRADQSGDWDTDEDSITSEQASAIVANTAKTGITTSQANAITANTAKVGLSNTAVTDAHLAGNISLSKLASGTAGKIVGFNSSTGAPEEQDAPAGGAEAGTLVLPYDNTIGNHTSPTGATSSSNANVDIAHTLNAPTTSMGYTNGGGQATAFALSTSPVFSPSQTSTSYSFSTTSQNWSGGRCYAEYSNDGGSTWTQFATLSANGTDSGTLVVQFNRIRIMGYRQWYQWTGYYTPSASLFYTDAVLPTHVFSGTQGTTWGEYWTSTQETNPFIYVDMGSSTLTSQIAIYHNSTDTSETEYQIQTSDNASTWTTRRTINVSDLTNDSWNFIRFNPTSVRYVRVYGSSGNSLVMSIDEIKVLKGIDVTTATNIQNHGHLTISATDTTLSLEGL